MVCGIAACAPDLIRSLSRKAVVISLLHSLAILSKHFLLRVSELEEIRGNILGHHHANKEMELSKFKCFVQNEPIKPGLEFLYPIIEGFAAPVQLPKGSQLASPTVSELSPTVSELCLQVRGLQRTKRPAVQI